MKPFEARSLTEALHAVIEWEMGRSTGPVQIELMAVPDPPAIVLTLLIAEFPFSEQESMFLSRSETSISLNGSTPPSLIALRDATTRLARIGGSIGVGATTAGGLRVEFTIPVDPKDHDDATAKLRLVEREIRSMGDIDDE